ncbi:MAG: c-type cytochrome [Bacteroidetes bacterium]|mgnify:CR=1 FL=1|nr:c-type cytochrome [Bacteroidota bacterium]MBS1591998.1 c-type cytochrome [Bacteroidota bacterium]MBS1640426.1 c-type cytochrome [Bacteroidota bacterium]MBS1642722.1 c-type cytochrome [Bacteroidota bacterium]MBS1670093.1 c-type cytochrome [Bacteroidota bacterium]
MLKQNKKITVVVAILSVIFISTISFTSHVQPRYKNLKVLPQDISHDGLDSVMDGFKAALGVKCNFCHAPSKTQPGRMDMASDENPHKDIARNMLRMTIEMNDKYIANIPHADTVKLQSITCATCHRGQAIPTVTK